MVIELNLDTFRELKTEGIQAVYGDASQRDTLMHAAVQKATSLILTTAGMPGSQELIRLAKELNPAIQVFARSVHLREASALRQAGADSVFSGEGEVALSMTEFMLRQAGATPEQIDRDPRSDSSRAFRRHPIRRFFDRNLLRGPHHYCIS